MPMLDVGMFFTSAARWRDVHPAMNAAAVKPNANAVMKKNMNGMPLMNAIIAVASSCCASSAAPFYRAGGSDQVQ